MNRKSWVSVILLVLIIAMLGTGCSSNGKQLTPQQISEKILTAYSNTKTYKMDLTLSQEMSMQEPEEGKTIKFGIETTGTGAIDSAAKSMQINMDMKMNLLEGAEEIKEALPQQSMKMDLYFINNTMYAYMDVLKSWIKQEMTNDLAETMWNQQDQMNQQVELLKNAEINVIKEETIDNSSCYVVSAKIKPEILKEQMEEQMNQFAQASGSQLPVETSNLNIKEYNFIYWVDQESFFVRKCDFTAMLDFAMTAGEEGNEQAINNQMKMSGTFKYYDLNKPVEINLPVEAQNAQTVPIPGQ